MRSSTTAVTIAALFVILIFASGCSDTSPLEARIVALEERNESVEAELASLMGRVNELAIRTTAFEQSVSDVLRTRRLEIEDSEGSVVAWLGEDQELGTGPGVFVLELAASSGGFVRIVGGTSDPYLAVQMEREGEQDDVMVLTSSVMFLDGRVVVGR